MTSRIKNSGRRGIRRYDYDGATGWQVRYSREGVRFQKVFLDNHHGGEAGALAAAEAFHGQLVSYFPPMLRREFMDQRRSNTNEIVGVARIIRKAKQGRYQYPAWVARWTRSDGKAANKAFLVSQHGEEAAKRLAIELRRQKLAEFGDQPVTSYPADIVWIVSPDELAIASNVDLDSDLEGGIALRQHRARERSRELRAAKLEAFRAQNGCIYCEICSFDFERFYGALGAGLIEVHHTKAIADYEKEEVTELADLILVCSNCHYVIHRDRHYERNYQQLRQVVALRQNLQIEKKGTKNRKA